MTYLVAQKERGAEGTEHIQAYCYFENAVAFTTVKTIFQGAHIEAARGSPEENRTYCTKEETRVSGPWEYGTLPEKGKRNDLLSVKADLDEGMHMTEIADKHFSQYIRYHKSFHAYRLLKTRELMNLRPFAYSGDRLAPGKRVHVSISIQTHTGKRRVRPTPSSGMVTTEKKPSSSMSFMDGSPSTSCSDLLIDIPSIWTLSMEQYRLLQERLSSPLISTQETGTLIVDTSGTKVIHLKGELVKSSNSLCLRYRQERPLSATIVTGKQAVLFHA